MEKSADSDKSALARIKEKYGFEAKAIVTMKEVVDSLYVPGGIITDELKKEIDSYYEEWGAK